jgi:type II restriction enzyme
LPAIEEARQVLKALGLPDAQQNEISALTLLALLRLGPDDPWTAATRDRRRVSRDIMAFIADRYGRSYAPNTRETIRRQVLHQFLQARIADYNPFEPDLPTNSPRAHYAVSEAVLPVIQSHGSPRWDEAVARFIAEHGSLAATYTRRRSAGTWVPLTLPDGRTVELSPGLHNRLQKAVLEEFVPRFAPGAALLYLGDTARKRLIMDTATLDGLGWPMSDHDKLPDIVLYDAARAWLFLIEVVTSHGPMSPKRVLELEERLQARRPGAVYVSAFPTMAEFRKHMREIAWETEVWIAEAPDHMIHFDGDRFLGPRRGTPAP